MVTPLSLPALSCSGITSDGSLSEAMPDRAGTIPELSMRLTAR